METVVIPKPAYNVLRRLTGESRPDVALTLALKDLIHFRLDASREKIAAFKQKYNANLAEFEQMWQAGKIAEKYSYPVENDLWEWEAATTDAAAFEEFLRRIVEQANQQQSSA